MLRENSKTREIEQKRARMNVLEIEYNQLEQEIQDLEKQEQALWVKQNSCEICGAEGYTEWHHIISQHKCRQEGLDHLISSRANVVELCQRCHDLTTASLLRKNMEGKTRVSEENADAEPTERQINYIRKLGGEVPENLTRKGASLLIDELKNLKENQTQTS
jgi:5-methylcytosine-specific restriction endonuclease McrA